MKRFSHPSAIFYAGLAALSTVLGWPAKATAHLVTTGLGPVYDGIGHLAMTPEDLIPALAIALYAGLRGAELAKQALFILPLAWFLGGVLGIAIEGLPALPIPAISFLVLGILIAADRSLSRKWFSVLITGVGFVHGILNGIVLKDGPGFLGLVGIMAALFVIVALVAAFTVSLKKPWARIMVRVVGSWVAAIGILMFGWLFRGIG
jgi:urease accessory protein